MHAQSTRFFVSPLMAVLMVTQPLTLYAQQAPRAPGVDPSAPDFPAEQDDGVVEAIRRVPSAGDSLIRVDAVPFVDEQQQIIDRRSSRLLCTAVDMIVPAGTINLEIERNLQLDPADSGLLGSQWRMNWEKHVLAAARVALLVEGAGQTIFYATSEAAYRALDGRKLDFAPQHAICTNRDGSREYYGPDGRLIAIDHLNGNKIILEYDAIGRLSRLAGPFGTFIRFDRNAQGRVTRIEGSNGAVVQYAYGDDTAAKGGLNDALSLEYAYDRNGRLARLDHPSSGTTTLTYDDAGRILSRKFSDGSIEKYAYDDEQRVWSFQDSAGYVTETHWSQDGKSAAIRSARGFATILQYDGAGRTTRVAGPTGAQLQIGYDNLGRVAQVADSVRGPTQFLYDGESNKASASISPGGESESIRYDDQQNPTTVSHGKGKPANSEVEYFTNGQVKSVVRGDGEQVELTYDDRGFIQSITDGTGATRAFAYDTFGNPVQETDVHGTVTQRTYDMHNRITSETDPTGAATRIQYDARGQVAKVVDARGGETVFEYDQPGRLISKTDPMGRKVHYKYSTAGEVSSITQTNGGTYQFKYDPDRNLLGIVNPLDGGEAMVYDATGNVTSSISASGVQAQFQYSAAGQLIQETDASGGTQRFTYDAQGRLVRTIDNAGQVTRYVFNEQGQMGMVIPSAGTVAKLKYDEQGNLTEMIDGDTTVAHYAYNTLGQRIREESAAGHVVNYQYTADGRLLSWNDNLGAGAETEYDAVGRPTVVKSTTGATLVRRYDSSGNVVEDIDAGGAATKYTYNLANELTEVVDPIGDRVRLEYDSASQPSKAHLPGGGTTQTAYDPLGNPVKQIDPLGNQRSRTFDADGRLVAATDAKGQTTRFEYDRAGRIACKRLADDTVVNYTYDKDSNLASIDDGVYPVRYEYDERGNRVRVEYPAIKKWIAYRYDEKDQLLEYSTADGALVHYGYDQFDRIESIDAKGVGEFTFKYDASGRVLSQTCPNGVRSIMKYDSEDRITRLAHLDEKLQTLDGWKYEYDANGNCISADNAQNQTTRYAYDANGQLTEESQPEQEPVRYEYAAGGNRTLRADAAGDTRYEYDLADQAIKAGEGVLKYDANGNLIERQSTEGITQYHYDAQDQLVRVDLPGGSSVEYGYAATGERIWRKDEQGTTHFLSMGPHVIAELDATYAAQKTFVHGRGIDRPLAVSDADKVAFLHADRRGSIRHVSDADGKATAAYRYDAFGRRVDQEGDPVSPFTFAGKSYDAATGLYYFRARYYDPDLGRFLSRDPEAPAADDPITYNPYQFARNNPVRFADPLGTSEFPIDMGNFGGFLDDIKEGVYGRYDHIKDKWYVYEGAKDAGVMELAGVHETDHRRRINGLMRKWAVEKNAGLIADGAPQNWLLDPDNLSTNDRDVLSRGKIKANGHLTALGKRLERAARFKQAKMRILKQGLGEGDEFFDAYMDKFEQYGGDRNRAVGYLNAEKERRKIERYRAWKKAQNFAKYKPPSFSSFAPPSRWQRMGSMAADSAKWVAKSRGGQLMGSIASGGKRLVGPLAILLTVATIANAGENMANEAVNQGLNHLVGMGGMGLAMMFGGPLGVLVGMGTLYSGSTLARTLANLLVTPAKRDEAIARERTANREDLVFIPQTTAVEAIDYDGAKGAFGPAERNDERGIDYYLDRAEQISERLKDANNAPLADYRGRAGFIDQQLTEQERIRAQQIAEHNRRVAQDNARRAADMQRWQAQQRRQATQTFGRVMQPYWQPGPNIDGSILGSAPIPGPNIFTDPGDIPGYRY